MIFYSCSIHHTVGLEILQFKKRYYDLNATGVTLSTALRDHQSARSRLNELMRELSDDESGAESGSDDDATSNPKDVEKPWLKEFNAYLHGTEDLGGRSIVQWWGMSTTSAPIVTAVKSVLQLNTTHYPVWASLALDYLPIMASSVSSERAFSSASITISKRRNRLGPDLVEALQFLKCWFRHDLIFREDPTIASEYSVGQTKQNEENEEGWDQKLLENGDNDDEMDLEPDGDDDDDIFLFQ